MSNASNPLIFFNLWDHLVEDTRSIQPSSEDIPPWRKPYSNNWLFLYSETFAFGTYILLLQTCSCIRVIRSSISYRPSPTDPSKRVKYWTQNVFIETDQLNHHHQYYWYWILRVEYHFMLELFNGLSSAFFIYLYSFSPNRSIDTAFHTNTFSRYRETFIRTSYTYSPFFFSFSLPCWGGSLWLWFNRKATTNIHHITAHIYIYIIIINYTNSICDNLWE